MGTVLVGEAVGATDAAFGWGADAVDVVAGTSWGETFDEGMQGALDYVAAGDPKSANLANWGARVGWAGTQAAMVLSGGAALRSGLSGINFVQMAAQTGKGTAVLVPALVADSGAVLSAGVGTGILTGSGYNFMNGPPQTPRTA